MIKASAAACMTSIYHQNLYRVLVIVAGFEAGGGSDCSGKDREWYGRRW